MDLVILIIAGLLTLSLVGIFYKPKTFMLLIAILLVSMPLTHLIFKITSL